MTYRILAIVGSYRPGHTIDQAAQAVLTAAAARGATVDLVQLRDCHIEFCTNCRACTQMPGPAPGPCPLIDDMAEIIGRIEAADALLLAVPVNFWQVTALFKRFMERLVCYAYWPWGMPAPNMRKQGAKPRPAVLITATAMPGLIARFTTGAMKSLAITAKTVGILPVGRLYVGQAGQQESQPLTPRTLARARRLAAKLVPQPLA